MKINVTVEELTKDLACYGCEFRYACLLEGEEFESGKDQCDVRYEDAQDFVNEYFDEE